MPHPNKRKLFRTEWVFFFWYINSFKNQSLPCLILQFLIDFNISGWARARVRRYPVLWEIGAEEAKVVRGDMKRFF